jgi:hypothetical protein
MIHNIQPRGFADMPRLPQYCRIINDYRQRVDSYLKETYGHHRYKRLRNNLLRGLILTLLTGKEPKEKPDDRALRSILRKLGQQMASHQYRIPKAWFEHRRYGAGRRTVAFRWRVHPREMKYLEDLWHELRYNMEEYRALLDETRPAWRFDVDEIHEEVIVWLDDRAIEDIVLVALEAYAVPKGRGVRFTETYGICFGSTKSTDEKRLAHGRHTTCYVHVNSVHIQVRAEGYPNKVTYDFRSLETQMEVARHLFPQLDIVGDFHTHPYKDADQLKSIKGWRYSRGDESSIPAWVIPLRKMGYKPRISLIVGIGKGGKRIIRPGRLKPNVIRFSIDKYHFYLAGFRIIGDRYSDKHITMNSIALPGM